MKSSPAKWTATSSAFRILKKFDEWWKKTERTELTCEAVRQGVQRRWPQGSIRMSLLFSAQILHNCSRKTIQIHMTKLIDEKWKLSRCIISTLLAVWRHVWISSVQKFLSQQSDNLTTPQSHDATISPGRCCPSHSTARTAPVSPSRDPQESPAHIRMCFYKGCSCITRLQYECDSMYLQFSVVDCNIEMMI